MASSWAVGVGRARAVPLAWPLPAMKGPEEHGAVRLHAPLLTLTPTCTHALTHASTHSLKEPGMF